MSIAPLSFGDCYYDVIGQGDPLVCVAGFGADHHVWDSIIPMLSPHYQLVLLDNPGCGQSALPNQAFFIEDFAKGVIELCDYLGIAQAYFLGSSMGGAIVQQLAFTYPERVKKAIISNSFMRAKSLSFSLFAQARSAWFDLPMPQTSVIQAMLPWAFSGHFLTDENVQKLTEFTLNHPYPQTKAGYHFQLQALLPFDASSWLHKINVPCLFIASDEDAICFPSQIQDMAKQVKNSEYVCIQRAGHLPHIEYPQLFSDQVESFLIKKIE